MACGACAQRREAIASGARAGVRRSIAFPSESRDRGEHCRAGHRQDGADRRASEAEALTTPRRLFGPRLLLVHPRARHYRAQSLGGACTQISRVLPCPPNGRAAAAVRVSASETVKFYG
jgi:hypothetical protein